MASRSSIDEFNRSRAEAHNVLLGILEERLLELPTGRGREGTMQMHPKFAALFTSNPEEYAGVHKMQDALLDRMITNKVGYQDRETEAAITAAKSGLSAESATRIVDIVRKFRGLGVNNHRPTIRACIMIPRIVVLRGARVEREDRFVRKAG
ncbi:MAG: AAA family ATPase [Gemmataceae bacterium]